MFSIQHVFNSLENSPTNAIVEVMANETTK